VEEFADESFDYLLKRREATEAPQTGGRSQVPFQECVLKEDVSATTPSALFSERDVFS
jgi:hypothetical protein